MWAFLSALYAVQLLTLPNRNQVCLPVESFLLYINAVKHLKMVLPLAFLHLPPKQDHYLWGELMTQMEKNLLFFFFQYLLQSISCTSIDDKVSKTLNLLGNCLPPFPTIMFVLKNPWEIKVHVNKQTYRKLNTCDIFMSLHVLLFYKSNYFFTKPQGFKFFWVDFYLALVILQRKLSLLQGRFRWVTSAALVWSKKKSLH